MASPQSSEETNIEDQLQELDSLMSIFNNEITILSEGKEFLISIQVTSDKVIDVTLPTAFNGPPDVDMPAREQKAYVSHLPPVTLYIRYHDNYPSDLCPHFHVSSRWLNPKLTGSINHKMKELFIPGLPTVYDWIMYISNDLIDDYCHIQHGSSTIEMMVPSNKLFVRSLSEFNDVEEHDKFEEYKDFLSNRHECSICTDRKDGQYFCERCRECDDGSGLFCKDCVTEYCQTLLSEGRVTQLSCPATSCKRLLPDDLVKSLLSTQLYDKYIKMRDEVHLDLIPGMVYCPRSTCRSRIASEPQSDLAICSICQFPFCKLCRQTWHGIEPCHILSQINDKDDSNDDSTKNTKQHKTEEEIKRKVEELKSMLWMRSHRNVKQCPKCSSTIQKIGGCNKMTCWKCGASFCWLCEELVAGYGHFDTRRCELFRNEDYQPPQEEKESNDASANLPDNQEQLEMLLESACPRCGLIEQKTTNNNWIKCRRCQLPFCLLCREPCYGRYHFNEYGCHEFSTLKQDMERQQQLKEEI